jgi:SAM-dependent methyltransferase
VRWHDLECGRYQADLPLWRELAAAAGGSILDLGAGAGRVTIDLHRRGHEVTALDRDPALLGALNARAPRVFTVLADARAFMLPASRFALALMPMQTIQLLGGPAGRAACLAEVGAHLRTGGGLAIALADPLEGFDAEHTEPPLPDIAEHDGWVYSSQAVRVRCESDATVIERIRQIVSPTGEHRTEGNRVRLDHLDAARLEAEGAATGAWRIEPRRRVAATEEHVSSDVVVLRRA